MHIMPEMVWYDYNLFLTSGNAITLKIAYLLENWYNKIFIYWYGIIDMEKTIVAYIFY